MHIRQPIVATLETIRQPRVLETEAVQDRCVQVVNVNRIARDVVAVVVAFAVADDEGIALPAGSVSDGHAHELVANASGS